MPLPLGNDQAPQGVRQTPTPLIVHYHIFKNAGTSIDEALHRSFGTGWQTFEGRHAHDVRPAEDIRDFLAANPGTQALSTHLGRPPLPREDALPIVFLRHPLLRARSVFEFLRGDASHPGPKTSFPAFVEWALDSRDGGIVIRDYQVVHLSSASFCRPSILEARATQAHLEEALALLKQWGTVGIVEDFERSLQRFQRRYGPRVPRLSLTPHWLNRTTTSQIRPLPAMLAEVEALLGDALHRTLAEANRLDLALYAFARRLAAEADAPAQRPHRAPASLGLA